MRWPAASCASLLLLAAPAGAATLTITFTGTVDVVSPQISSGPFEAGDSISGSLQIDSATPDTDALPTEGEYLGAISNLTFSFGDYDGTGAGENQLHMRDGESNVVDNFFVQSEFAGPDVAGFPPQLFHLDLGDSENAVFTSDVIPASLDLADFEIRGLFIGFLDGNNVYGVNGTITSLTYAVPEPGALALLALGAVTGMRPARRRD
jgi:hypothetical protein